MGTSPSKGGAMGACYGRSTPFYRPHPVAVLWYRAGGTRAGGRVSLPFYRPPHCGPVCGGA
jgi:hypothetical protein